MPTVRGNEIRGIAFPITKGREGYWPRRNGKAIRQSSIIMILGTFPGERVMEIEFGSRLPYLLFEPNDKQLLIQLQQETIGSLARWDPNIRVMSVSPEQVGDQVKLFIDYIDLADVTQEPRQTVFTLRRV